MLARWTEILPLFVIRWLAVRRCEKFRLVSSTELRVVMARPDVLIKIESDKS